MGTKRNPGRHDYYDAARPDEPMFVLLARDPSAPLLVRQWAEMRPTARPDKRGDPREAAKIAEALALAEQMERWRDENRTDSKPQAGQKSPNPRAVGRRE